MGTTKTTDKKIFLAAAEMADLEDFIRERGESAFRARQIREWIVKRRTVHPAEMTNLSAAAMMSALTMLQIKGLVDTLPGKRYQLRQPNE